MKTVVVEYQKKNSMINLCARIDSLKCSFLSQYNISNLTAFHNLKEMFVTLMHYYKEAQSNLI